MMERGSQRRTMWTVVVAVMLVVASVSQWASAAVNIVDNPGFEDGTTGWLLLGSPTLTADTSVVYAGSASCKVANRTATYYGAQQELLGEVEKGTTLVISAWVRLDNSASDRALLQVRYEDDGGTHYETIESRTITNTAWAQLSGTWEVDWTGELTYMSVRVAGPAVGVNFYTDEIFVGKREIITNPTFENGTLGWRALGASTLTTDTADHHGGGNSMWVSDRTATWHGLEQDMMGVLEDGDVIEGSAWVKVDSGTDQTISFTMKCIDDGGTHYSTIATKVVDATDGWVRLSGAQTVSCTGTVTYLTVRFAVSTSLTSFHVDDAYLQKTQVLRNPTFDDNADHWVAVGGASYATTASETYDGAGSVFVYDRSYAWSGVEQDLVGIVQKGDILNGSARFRLESGSDQSVSFSIKYYDDEGVHYASLGSGTASSDRWTRVSGVHKVDWTGTLTSFNIRLVGPDGGINFYADGLSIARYQGPECVAEWRSSLYPENWTPGYSDGDGNFLHDFSYAGYHQGRRLLPDNPPGDIYDVTGAPYYADNTGTNDATGAIQDAIDDAGAAGGGVVYLPAGTYRILPPAGANQALLIGGSGVVLRGDGPDRTYVFNDETYMRYKSVIHARPATADWHTALSGTTVYATADVMSPTFTIPLTDSSGFAVGDWVVLRTDCTEDFAAEHLMSDLWGTAVGGVTLLRKVMAVDTVSNTITVDIPTRYYMKTRDNFRAYKINPPIEEVGVEHLSLGMREHPGTTGWEDDDIDDPTASAYDVHASCLLKYYNVANGWVRGVHSYRPAVNTNDYHALSVLTRFSESQNVTVTDCIVEKPQYEGGGGNGYGYVIDCGDCLFENCIGHHTRHNFTVTAMYTTGNVLLRGMSIDPRYCTDLHRQLSVANLFDSMDMDGDYLEGRYRPFGEAPTYHGQTSSECVFWNSYGTENCDIRLVISRQWNKGYVIGTAGPVHSVALGTTDNTAPEDFLEGEGKADGLLPQSLYDDQLLRRLPDTVKLGNQIVTNGGFEDGTTGWGSITSSIGTTTTVKRSGDASAYVTNRTQTYSSIYQHLVGSVEQGQILELIAWVRLDNAASDDVSMYLKRTDDSGSRWFNLDTVTATNSGWTRLHAVWTANWTGTLSELRLYFPNLDVGNSFYIDDVSVTVTGF